MDVFGGSQDKAKTPGAAPEPTAVSVLENTSFCALVYDVTNKDSFDRCTKWLEMCRKYRKNMNAILVGNKADLTDRQVCMVQSVVSLCLVPSSN